MADVYFEDCISLTRRFDQPQRLRIIDLHAVLAVHKQEAAMGMNLGEMKQRLDHPTNILHVLPAFEFLHMQLSFRPPQHILERLWELYKYNDTCPLSERQRVEELPEFQDVTYTLEIAPRFREDIYLKHPVTGQIDVHQYPYGDFPRFRLRTAHPAMVAKHAAGHVLAVGRAGSYLDLAYRVYTFCNHMTWPRRTQSAQDSPHCPTTPPSHKQTARQDTNDHNSSVKRSRKSAATLTRRAAMDCLSLVPSPHTRKRKTSPEADSAIPSPAKRVRGTPVTGIDSRLPSVAGDKETQVGPPCKRQRPPRAAKTLAGVRMTRVH
ncbi:hypothetical protein CYLTODRAFT_489592 [Cylindrobasidium torrendii FP15055 ss-10]|uniref:Uncharacterized protein n=1 Tax=Cylindrobasidium torrendii FP15055 ss-10 TaxID=1314674 RepID=A0A0D7BEY6_9AGAR|nr:hypothetical protein CYLTODRAFT_489592 [Cylindrobasidium torrendii FP15055 ss-10]